jgi:hypothetical protein
MIPAGSSSPADQTPDTSGVSAELMPFYGQTLDWSACGSGMDCDRRGADWDPGKGASISPWSAIARPASQGSLLTNPGGGASRLELIKSSLSFAVSPTLIKNYDVIGFDPRGVEVLDRREVLDASQMDDYLYSIRPGARAATSGPPRRRRRTRTSPTRARRTATASCRTSRP